jgi:superoxide dismutase
MNSYTLHTYSYIETQPRENHENFSQVVSRFYKHQIEASTHSLSFTTPTGRRHQSCWNILNNDAGSNKPSNTIQKSLIKSTYKSAQNFTSNLKLGPHISGFFILLIKKWNSVWAYQASDITILS